MNKNERRPAEMRAILRKAKSDVAARRMEEERIASDKRKNITPRDPNSKNSQKREAKKKMIAALRKNDR